MSTSTKLTPEQRKRVKRCGQLRTRLQLLPRRYSLRWLEAEAHRSKYQLSRILNGRVPNTPDELLDVIEAAIADAEHDTGGARWKRRRRRSAT